MATAKYTIRTIDGHCSYAAKEHYNGILDLTDKIKIGLPIAVNDSYYLDGITSKSIFNYNNVLSVTENP